MSAQAETDPDFERLLEYLKTSRSFDFTGYKRASLARRTAKRMHALQIDGYDAYLDYLESNPDEFVELFNTILINVTSFFRDAECWEHIRDVIAPCIADSKSGQATIRVWCPGCASGEEPYTAAMIFAEALGPTDAATRLKVYATDVDMAALEKARQAVYTAEELAGVPDEYREKYFEPDGTGYTFDRDLRRNVIFGRHDLVQDAPISRVDLLICRNTLMYLNAETQTRVLENLNFALNDDGYLFLGKSEMLLTRQHLFAPVDRKRRIFRRVPVGEIREGVRPGRADAVEAGSAELLRAAGFEAGAPPQLVVDRNGTLVLANQDARVVFGLTQSDIGRPIQDLEISYRPAELRPLIAESKTEGRPVTLRDASWEAESGNRVFEIRITPLLSRGGDPLGTSVVYLDVTSYRALQEELEQSKSALEQAYKELKSSNEELETTNEELQSTNEELETTNEELHSTNEELETMNEELQATNEELETMNNEFREQTTELNSVNSFLENVLTGLGAAVVVLDERARVLAWNATAEEMWGLRLDEVRGESFFGLDIGLPVDQLRAPVRSCLDGEGASEVVISAVNRRGTKIRCRAQCRPLSGVTGDQGGVLLLLEEQSPGGGN
jgi:two-component system CheB/CheR fusion protein